jgi:hypothetical protein
MTRGDVLRAVHAYVQNAALVDSHSQTVRCDRHLKAVFKVDAVELAALAERIDEHLQAAPPVGVTLPLAVPNSAVVQLAVDVAVHDAADELPPLEDSRAAQAEIDALMAQIDACEKRRLFYLDFHQRPLAVLNELVTSMANDRALDEIGTVEPSDDTLAAMFHSAATDDAVRAYLAKHESSRRVFVQRT